MYDIISIVIGLLIIGLFMYVMITDGWKIVNILIKKLFSKKKF